MVRDRRKRARTLNPDDGRLISVMRACSMLLLAITAVVVNLESACLSVAIEHDITPGRVRDSGLDRVGDAARVTDLGAQFPEVTVDHFHQINGGQLV